MIDSMEVLSAEGQDRERWLELLAQIAPLETYAHPGWLRRYCSTAESPRLLVVRRPQGPLIFPIIVRSLGALPWVPEPWREHVDVTGPPYGWTGPFGAGLDDGTVARFWDAFAAWGRANRVICDYRLFCPAAAATASYPGERVAKMPVVVLEFPTTEDALWRQYDHKVRKNVKRARAAGLSVEMDESGNRLDEFLEVFWSTLDRRAAGRSYYFDRSHFEALVRECPGGLVFFHVLEAGRVISTELVVRAGAYLYSFLGGTRLERFEVRPNDLLKHEACVWGMRHGHRGFVLGGGNAGEDGIFRYKLAFAPQGRRQLEFGRWTLDPEAYEALTRVRLARVREDIPGAPLRAGFFPEYRAAGGLPPPSKSDPAK